MAAQEIRPFDLMTENYGRVKDNHYDYVVLPWGSTEPHNYHLPYLTDCYLSFRLAYDAVQKAYEKYQVRGMVLPPIALGSQNPGQRELPFCIHTEYETQRLILRDVINSIYSQGFRRLVIMNGHGGNGFKQMIRDFMFEYPDMLIVLCEWYTVEPRQPYFEAEVDDHAGEQETSMMMYYYPHLVSLEQVGDGDSIAFGMDSLNNKVGWVPRDWNKVTADTGVGNPSKASAEKGEKFIRVVTDKIAYLFFEIVTKPLYK